MPCNLTRRDVSRIVLDVIREFQRDQTIVEASVFGPQGINNTREFRAGYFGPIRRAIEENIDCRIQRFSSTDCENARTVADIVTAVFNDVRPKPSRAAASRAAAKKTVRRAATGPSKASKTRKARKPRKPSKPSKARKPSKTRKASKPRKASKTSKASKTRKAKTKKR